jgi:predicted metal-dependent HD superfamily phosphohydrolase
MSFHHWTKICENYLHLQNYQEVIVKWWGVIENYMKVTEARPYHNLIHIADLLHLCENVFTVKDKTSVYLAVYFHDVIYDPKNGDNEERSARIFEEFAIECRELVGSGCEWATRSRINDIANWIRETSRHTTSEYISPFSQEDFHLFLDMDMSILGADRDRYAKYSHDVRQEYRHIPDKLFAKGRMAFLESLLSVEDEKLYRTSAARLLFLDSAKSNVRWEFDSLRNQILEARI